MISFRCDGVDAHCVLSTSKYQHGVFECVPGPAGMHSGRIVSVCCGGPGSVTCETTQSGSIAGVLGFVSLRLPSMHGSPMTSLIRFAMLVSASEKSVLQIVENELRSGNAPMKFYTRRVGTAKPVDDWHEAWSAGSLGLFS